MSEPIKVGDLVQIVKPLDCSCGMPSKIIGRVFRVSQIFPLVDSWCAGCFRPHPTTACAEGLDGGGKKVPLYRLKRIPPLPELEGKETNEDLREPA
jgi:hypothetical protein